MRKISECAIVDQVFIAPPTSTGGQSATATSTAAAPLSTLKQQNCPAGHQIPSDILDDLASRFIINVPDDERNNLIRICFQIELAHWFYLDFFCSIEEKKLIPCGIKQFATHLFHHIPFLRIHLSGIDKILEDWKEYKLSVPTYGAILMSEDLRHVLLVQSYWAKSSWGFPKGKVNEHEDPIHCATREVFEETGYDITGLIVPNDYIEAVINYQYTRLYLVRNVPLQTLFSPRTRKEIKCCEWFPVDSLPTNKNDVISKANLGINANSFFMIMPFIKRLKKWVHDNRSGIETSTSSQSSSSFTTPVSASKSINGRKNDTKLQIANFAVSLHSSSYKANFNCSGKRQRHKSMGDIDGIKINVTSNNCSSGSAVKLVSGAKSNVAAASNQSDANSDNSTTKREKFSKTNSKRQLFNTNSITNTTFSPISTSNTSNFDIKHKSNIDFSSVRSITENSTCNNGPNNRNRKCKSKSMANMKIHRPQQDMSPSTSAVTSVSKMNPNLDSWTSFTFTKNFIANVFC